MGNRNGKSKKQAHEAAEAGCEKPREPPFQAAFNRKH
jgi:hypothetical protein